MEKNFMQDESQNLFDLFLTVQNVNSFPESEFQQL